MPDTSRRPRKQPRQARSLATVEVILDAAALLLVEDGYQRTTTNRIAERAGVSIGSLYQYFPNRNALVGVLDSRTDAQLSEAIWQTIAQCDARDLRGFIGFGLKTAINQHARVLPLLRVLLETRSDRPWAQLPGSRLQRRQSRLQSLFDSHGDELRLDFDRDAGSFLIPKLVGSALDAAIAFRPGAFANGELERELTTMLSYYLTGRR
jgi:AcrR family transcriptional regulator